MLVLKLILLSNIMLPVGLIKETEGRVLVSVIRTLASSSRL